MGSTPYNEAVSVKTSRTGSPKGSNMARKEELRKILKSALREKFARTSPGEIRRLSLAAFGNLLQLPALKSAETVMLYVEMPREFPVTPFIPDLLNHPARRIVVPWCEGDRLAIFSLVTSDEVKIGTDLDAIFADRLAPGAYGIREPRESLRLRKEYLVEPRQVDLALLPGLGFDRTCRRLGRGKGYYDRFVTNLSRRVPLIGVCFDEQIVKEVPTEPHDRPLNYVITPTRLYAAEPEAAE